MADITGKNGKVKITEPGANNIIDTSANTTYIVANKKGENPGVNTFNFASDSGYDVIQGYDHNDTLTFTGATDFEYHKKATETDLIINKNHDKDQITLKQFFKDGNSIGGIVIDEVKIEGSGKIIGTKYNDLIFGGKKSDKITTGAGNDSVFSGRGKDTITIDGDGNKTLYFADGDGADTVVFDNKDAQVTLDFDEKEYIYGYTKSGKDLIIRTGYENEKEKDVYEPITLKNVFNQEKSNFSEINLVFDENTDTLDEFLSNDYVIISGVKNVFEGTKYKDEILCTKKADIITTGAGNDQILPGKGKDTITVNGGGKKEIFINNGDGEDTINFEYADEVNVNLYMSDSDIFSSVNTEDGVDIKRMYYAGNKLTTEITHLINITNNPTVKVNEVNINDLPVYNQIRELDPKKPNDVEINANQVVIGGKKTDKIAVGTDSSEVTNTVIFSGNGNDEITINKGSSIISGGKGADTINLNTTGTVQINHVSGDGNDVISLSAKPASLDIYTEYTFAGKSWDDYYSQYTYNLYSGNLGLHKSGNDLIFSTPVGKKAETITIKDYFAGGSTMPDTDKFTITQKLQFGQYLEGGTSTIPDLMHDWGIWADGVKDEETGITTYDAYGDYKNFYSYSGSGKTVFNGGINNDAYMVTLNKKSDLAISTGDTDLEDYDELFISANYKKVRAFFNVNADGGVTVGEDANSDNFMIFNKGSLTAANLKKMFDNDSATNTTGVINIDKFFGEGGTYDTGYMEDIAVSNNMLSNFAKYYSGGYKKIAEIDTDYWVASVKEKVSAWLIDHNYDSAFDVINNADDKTINAMLKVYQSVGNGAEFDPHYA